MLTFTEDQVREMMDKARAEERERCSKVSESHLRLAMKLPTFEDLLNVALERFQDDNNRFPTQEELEEMNGDARWAFSTLSEAYAEWMGKKS